MRYLHRKTLLAICSASVLCVLSIVFGYSADLQVDELSKFKSFASKQQLLFSGLKGKGLQMKGTIVITRSDGWIKLHGGPKSVTLGFAVLGADGKIKETVVPLGNANDFFSPRTYYLDSKQVVAFEGELAKMLPLGETCGLFDFCPAFLEYSFLGTLNVKQGIPALLPSTLAADDKWQSVIRNLQAGAQKKDGVLEFVTASSSGSCSIELQIPAKPVDEYRIKSISFSSIDKKTRKKVEVVEFLHDAAFGDIGKTYKKSIYYGNSMDPALTWEYKIDEFRIGGPVSDDELTFDPATASLIYDGESEKAIKVPH